MGGVWRIEMHPSSLLSYYPTYDLLDNIISSGGYKTLNLYIDLKNTLQTLYMEHAIVNLVESTIRARVVDSSIFASLISFLAFHKMYSIKRNVKIRYYIFFETGGSTYHQNISKKYKVSRRIDDLYGLDRDKRELFTKIVQKNLQLIESACNKMPHTNIIRLDHFEADFIPYYLTRYNFVDTTPDTAHLIYSNDHDMYQTVDDNIFIYSKSAKSRKIIKKGEAIHHLLKTDKTYPDNYFPLALSILGDTGDDVQGVKGIGGKRLADILDEVVTMVGGMDKLIENVMKRRNIFEIEGIDNQNKYISKILQEEKDSNLISKNMRLVSFEIISRIFSDPNDTETLEKRNKVTKMLTEKEIVDPEVLKSALFKSKVYLNEEDIDTIFFNYGVY